MLTTWNDFDLAQKVAHVANVLRIKAGVSFAPWRIGGARPFFLPKWVKSFERAHRGWLYEHELFVGKGHIYLPAFEGAWFAAQFAEWKPEQRGGKLEENQETGVFRFTPYREKDEWRWKMIQPGRKRLVSPIGDTLDSRGPLLVLPGRA